MTKSNIYYTFHQFSNHFKFCEIEVEFAINDIWLRTCFFLFLTQKKKCAFQFMVYLIKCHHPCPLLRAHLHEATTVNQVGGCCFFFFFFF